MALRIERRLNQRWFLSLEANRPDCSGGSIRGAPYGPKCSQFNVVFWKIWQDHMLEPPECWCPLLRGILDPPLDCVQKMHELENIFRGGSSLSRRTERNPCEGKGRHHTILSNFLKKIATN